MRGLHHPLHPRTRMALSDVRREGGKAIVLLNRRGWSNFVSCPGCGSQKATARKQGSVKFPKLAGKVVRAGSKVTLKVTLGRSGSGKYRFGAIGSVFQWPVRADGLGKRVNRCVAGHRKLVNIPACGAVDEPAVKCPEVITLFGTESCGYGVGRSGGTVQHHTPILSQRICGFANRCVHDCFTILTVTERLRVEPNRCKSIPTCGRDLPFCSWGATSGYNQQTICCCDGSGSHRRSNHARMSPAGRQRVLYTRRANDERSRAPARPQ